MGFISKIPRSFRHGAKWRKPLPNFPTTTSLKVKFKFFRMFRGLLRPKFAYLSFQAHLPPYSASCFPCTFICRHNIVSRLCALTPAIHPTTDSSLSSPPFRQFCLQLPFILWDWTQAPGQPSLNFQIGSSAFGFQGPLSFLPAHLPIESIGLLCPTYSMPNRLTSFVSSMPCIVPVTEQAIQWMFAEMYLLT